MRVLGLGVGQLLFLVLKADAADVAHGYRGTDDAHHAKRIGTGITAGYLRSAVGEYRCECFVGSTETRRVGDGTIECTDHHWKVERVAGVEEQEVAGEHHGDVQRNGRCGQQVKCYAALAEALEEARSHLQTDAEHKENQAQVLRKVQNVGRCREVNVTGDDSCEEHEGHAQRDTKDLYFAQQHAYADHNGVEQHDVGYRFGVGEKINDPIHIS